MQLAGTPDRHAKDARNWSKRGETTRAFNSTVHSIRARARWMLLNGKWVRRTPPRRD